MASIKIDRLSAAIGAEISGVDLSTALDDGVICEIRAALLQHGVIFFHHQQLDAQALYKFSQRFGMPVQYPFVAGTDIPEVVEVRKEADEKVNFGGLWHSDTSYLAKPPMASLLYAVEVPPSGGDTLFSSMTRAYQALPPQLSSAIGSARGINSSQRATAAVTRVKRMQDNPGNAQQQVFSASHPIVRTHPETGEKSLYCSDAHTVGVEGWSESRSSETLNAIYAIQQQDEFIYRFVWKQGSLAFWDNRCTQHYALNDYHGHRRVMYRVTLEGDVPI